MSGIAGETFRGEKIETISAPPFFEGRGKAKRPVGESKTISKPSLVHQPHAPSHTMIETPHMFSLLLGACYRFPMLGDSLRMNSGSHQWTHSSLRDSSTLMRFNKLRQAMVETLREDTLEARAAQVSFVRGFSYHGSKQECVP